MSRQKSFYKLLRVLGRPFTSERYYRASGWEGGGPIKPADPRKESPAPPDLSPEAVRSREKAAKRALIAPAAAIVGVVIVFVIDILIHIA